VKRDPQCAGRPIVGLSLTRGRLARPDANSEEVEEDAQDGEGRDRKDHPGQPPKLPTTDHRQEHDDRVDVERLSLDARREEVALELLDQDVGYDGQHGDCRGLAADQWTLTLCYTVSRTSSRHG
jgi:hypothetical protein